MELAAILILRFWKPLLAVLALVYVAKFFGG